MANRAIAWSSSSKAAEKSIRAFSFLIGARRHNTAKKRGIICGMSYWSATRRIWRTSPYGALSVEFPLRCFATSYCSSRSLKTILARYALRSSGKFWPGFLLLASWLSLASLLGKASISRASFQTGLRVAKLDACQCFGISFRSSPHNQRATRDLDAYAIPSTVYVDKVQIFFLFFGHDHS